jgi:hypothetical protein
MPGMIVQGKKLSTVELNWNEVFYTNCGMVSAGNVDQELGWCKTDFGQASGGDRGQARLISFFQATGPAFEQIAITAGPVMRKKELR